MSPTRNRDRWLKRRPKGGRKYVLRNVHPRKMDVMLSDLGYKIPYGQTRDLLDSRNGLNPDRVAASIKDGAIRKRLNQGVLMEVASVPTATPPRVAVADPATVSFPQRFKTFVSEESTDLSDAVADAVIEDDDEFLKEMASESGEDETPLVAGEPDSEDGKEE